MPQIRNFSEALEKDIQRLTSEIKERQKSQEGNLSEKEIIKKSLEIFSPVPFSKEKSEEEKQVKLEVNFEKDVLPSYLQGGEVDERIKLEVKKLIKLAFEEGIEKAIKEAKNYPPFIEDAFHDVLVEKLWDVFKKRGLFK